MLIPSYLRISYDYDFDRERPIEQCVLDANAGKQLP
jgi:hypothetical protein